MSDIDPNVNENQVDQNSEVHEPSELEQRAVSMGWRPKDDFHGNEDDFIDAKEFVRRQPLFDKIESQSKQIKAVTKALESFKDHYTRVEEAAVQKAIDQMKTQRKQALVDGDGDNFELYDGEIKKAEQQLATIEQTKGRPIVDEPVVNPEWTAFQTRNSWYNTTAHMRVYADQLGADLASKGMSPADVLKKVEEEVRKEFPTKFRNPNKDSAPDVESSRGNTKSGKTNEDSFLSEQERKIMNDLIRQKVLTKEKYIADLKAIHGLK